MQEKAEADMTSEEILKRYRHTVKLCGSRDPARICAAMNIQVMLRDLGSLKGMSMVMMRNPFIVINKSLPSRMMRAVMAHELGHLILHRDLLSEAALIRRQTEMKLDEQPEYEANLFAALLLVDMGEMNAMLKDGYSVEAVAKSMKTDENFIAILLHAFGGKTDVRRTPEMPRANFLR